MHTELKVPDGSELFEDPLPATYASSDGTPEQSRIDGTPAIQPPPRKVPGHRDMGNRLTLPEETE